MDFLKSLLDLLLSLIPGRSDAGMAPVATPPAVVPPVAPKQYLGAGQVARVKQYLPEYTKACHTVNALIPPLALACIHYRESEFDTKSTIPGGPFQFDPGGSGKGEVQKRIWDATVKICKKYGVKAEDIETTFSTACLVAAHELSSKIRGSIRSVDGTVDEDVLADALWGYNGRADCHTEAFQTGQGSEELSWQWSSYVAGDPQNGKTLKIRGTVPDANAPNGRKLIEHPDLRPGALIVYRELVSRSKELA